MGKYAHMRQMSSQFSREGGSQFCTIAIACVWESYARVWGVRVIVRLMFVAEEAVS